jgi:hypothetical protein
MANSLPPSIEPGLKLDDVCRICNCSRQTGERERAAGLWPRPDIYIGTGRRKSPRWRPATIHHRLFNLDAVLKALRSREEVRHGR